MSSTLENKKVDIIVASPSEDFKNFILGILEDVGGVNICWFKTNAEFSENNHLTKKALVAIIDCTEKTNDTIEWLQAIKMTFPSCKAYAVYTKIECINEKDFKKNGAHEIYHRYYDRDFIESGIIKTLPPDLALSQIPLSFLMPVNIDDLERNTEVNFDLYVHLPANKKTILLKKSGSILDDATVTKFAKLNAQMYIKKSQLRSFMDYSVSVASQRNTSNPVSRTEQFESTKEAMFTITSELMNAKLFQFQDGKSLFDRLLKVIQEVGFTKDRSHADLVKVFSQYTGNTRTVYNDIVCVAFFSAIIGQAQGLNSVQRDSLVIAALLHNIGLSRVGPFELVPGYEKTNPEFAKYPIFSVAIAQEKKMPLTKEIFTAIEQHRENVNGGGFPNANPNQNMNPIARVLRLAVRIQEMTGLNVRTSEAYTARAAVQMLKDEVLAGASPHEIPMVLALYKALKFT